MLHLLWPIYTVSIVIDTQHVFTGMVKIASILNLQQLFSIIKKVSSDSQFCGNVISFLIKTKLSKNKNV